LISREQWVWLRKYDFLLSKEFTERIEDWDYPDYLLLIVRSPASIIAPEWLPNLYLRIPQSRIDYQKIFALKPEHLVFKKFKFWQNCLHAFNAEKFNDYQTAINFLGQNFPNNVECAQVRIVNWSKDGFHSNLNLVSIRSKFPMPHKIRLMPFSYNFQTERRLDPLGALGNLLGIVKTWSARKQTMLEKNEIVGSVPHKEQKQKYRTHAKLSNSTENYQPGSRDYRKRRFIAPTFPMKNISSFWEIWPAGR
jgi:hypothetical protein